MNTFRFLIFTCLSLLPYQYLQAQTPLYVTSATLGTTGSLDQIINQAVASANAGQNVKVLFSAPGLCQITAQLPLISISNGSITFDKDPANSIVQGIQLPSASASNTSIGSGFNLSNTASGSAILIQNITIQDFGGNRTGIYLTNTSNVTIQSCTMLNNTISISYSKTTNLLIQNNAISSTTNSSPYGYGTISLFETGDNAIQYDSRIINNTISNHAHARGITVLHVKTPNQRMGHSVQIKNNSMQCGIDVENSVNGNVPAEAQADVTFNVEISGNTIASGSLTLEKPYQHWIIQNNTFNLGSGGGYNVIVFGEDAVQLSNPYGISFINSNSLSITPMNTGNVFLGSGTHYASFYIQFAFGTSLNIIGQNLPGEITFDCNDFIPNLVSTVIRQNKITSTRIPNSPIDFLTVCFENDTISAPTLSAASLSCNTLTAQYTLTGSELIQANADFAVDFYKSNTNGDLLDYLGTQTISTLNGGTYTALLPLPTGVVLIATDRIATTVTAYGNHQTPAQPIGTSQASYFTGINTTIPCPTILPCVDCISSFAPLADSTYIISGWVKENGAPITTSTYTNAQLMVIFPTQTFTFTGSGVIIDGWQRIEGTFLVPGGASSLDIRLNCLSGTANFDDIRVFPKKGMLKSYVYDPLTLRLVAELDERNYATIYEYDEEGKLIRVKKETERGIMTIKENKNSTVKVKNN